MAHRRPPRRPEPTRPARNPRARAGTHPGTRTTRTPIPPTVWVCEPSRAGTAGPVSESLVEQTVTALSEPGACVALLDERLQIAAAHDLDAVPDAGNNAGARMWELAYLVEHLGRHAGPLSSQPDEHPVGATAVPYWDALLDSATDAHLSPSIPGADNTDPPDSPTQDERPVDLVLALVGPEGVTDRTGLLAASRLRTSGILAVLTHSDTTGGRLRDPIGSIVASAQNADLLYLQHIIAVHAAVDHGTLTAPAPVEAINPGDAHQRVHTDVLVFAQPTEAAL